jgi:hypothetical protein
MTYIMLVKITAYGHVQGLYTGTEGVHCTGDSTLTVNFVGSL